MKQMWRRGRLSQGGRLALVTAHLGHQSLDVGLSRPGWWPPPPQGRRQRRGGGGQGPRQRRVAQVAGRQSVDDVDEATSGARDAVRRRLPGRVTIVCACAACARQTEWRRAGGGWRLGSSRKRAGGGGGCAWRAEKAVAKQAAALEAALRLGAGSGSRSGFARGRRHQA